jgi:integrase
MRSEITLEGGSLTVCLRGEVYYARVWLRDFQKYVWRSVRTADIETAKSRARKYLYEVETKQEQGLPLQSKTVNAVIDDYVAMREKDHLRGATKAGMQASSEVLERVCRGSLS